MITEDRKVEISQQLKEGEVVIEFTKINGDYRKMTCTLSKDIIPKATKKDPLTEEKVRKINPEVCVVYDVNAKGWRSFRWDTVITNA
tara:strand:- start:1392 stop:1652 length:261 start_codon:yes stop_codon:yes gene_type:complete